MAKHYLYVIYAEVEDGQLKGFHMDLGLTETAFKKNVWDCESGEYELSNPILETSIIMNLGNLLALTREEEAVKPLLVKDGKNIPW